MKMKPTSFKQYLLLALSLLLLLPNFLPYSLLNLPQKGLPWERFDPKLTTKIRSVNDLLNYADVAAKVQHVPSQGLEYGVLLSRLVKDRFYFGYSHYSLKENWIASLAGKFIWNDLSAIVIPDDICQYPMAACSQQNMVLIECFRRRKIPFRVVNFKHHFATEAFFNEKWYFFDPTLEPDFRHNIRTDIDSLMHSGSFYRAYKNVDTPWLKYTFGSSASVLRPNVLVGSHAILFHKMTKIASKILWLIPFTFFYVSLFYKIRRKNLNKIALGKSIKIRKIVFKNWRKEAV